jgi:hypothetical protein
MPAAFTGGFVARVNLHHRHGRFGQTTIASSSLSDLPSQ